MINKNSNDVRNGSTVLGKFLATNGFFIFSIFVVVMIIGGGREFLITHVAADPSVHILVVLALIEIGFFSADRTITEYINNDENIKSGWTIFAAPFMVMMTLATDIIYFEISMHSLFGPYLEDEVRKQIIHNQSIQAQIFSLWNIGSFGIFFYGKRIWNNIRRRDLENPIQFS